MALHIAMIPSLLDQLPSGIQNSEKDALVPHYPISLRTPQFLSHIGLHLALRCSGDNRARGKK